jgi:hypothetical protein
MIQVRFCRNRRADWDVVLRADATPPESQDWRHLQQLLRQALPAVEEKLRTGPLLLTYPGLLARYGAMKGERPQANEKVERKASPGGRDVAESFCVRYGADPAVQRGLDCIRPLAGG